MWSLKSKTIEIAYHEIFIWLTLSTRHHSINRDRPQSSFEASVLSYTNFLIMYFTSSQFFKILKTRNQIYICILPNGFRRILRYILRPSFPVLSKSKKKAKSAIFQSNWYRTTHILIFFLNYRFQICPSIGIIDHHFSQQKLKCIVLLLTFFYQLIHFSFLSFKWSTTDEFNFSFPL